MVIDIPMSEAIILELINSVWVIPKVKLLISFLFIMNITISDSIIAIILIRRGVVSFDPLSPKEKTMFDKIK